MKNSIIILKKAVKYKLPYRLVKAARQTTIGHGHIWDDESWVTPYRLCDSGTTRHYVFTNKGVKVTKWHRLARLKARKELRSMYADMWGMVSESLLNNISE